MGITYKISIFFLAKYSYFVCDIPLLYAVCHNWTSLRLPVFVTVTPSFFIVYLVRNWKKNRKLDTYKQHFLRLHHFYNYEIFPDHIIEKNIYFTHSEYYKMILIYPHRPIYCYF